MISIQNISKNFGKFQIKDISFNIPLGYICGIIGMNGAGKTTLINLLLNTIKPDSGSITFGGLSAETNREDILDMIGYVLVDELFDSGISLLENGKYYGSFYKNFDLELLESYLNQFNLDGQKNFGKLSKGQKLKFQFAFALSHKPKYLIMDEPAANFDPEFRADFFRIIKDFISDGEHTVLISSHLTDDLDLFADYILYIDNGTTIYAGDIEGLRKKYILLSGAEYLIKLLPPENIIYIEKTNYTTRALIKNSKYLEYNSKLDASVPTLEDLMFFFVKGGYKNV